MIWGNLVTFWPWFSLRIDFYLNWHWLSALQGSFLASIFSASGPNWKSGVVLPGSHLSHGLNSSCSHPSHHELQKALLDSEASLSSFLIAFSLQSERAEPLVHPLIQPLFIKCLLYTRHSFKWNTHSPCYPFMVSKYDLCAFTQCLLLSFLFLRNIC